MSEKVRKVGGVNYVLGKAPLDYHCDHCLVSGVKLWREYNTMASVTKLLCAHCAGKIEGKDVSKIDEHGRIDIEIAGKTDQIGSYIPAVPVEGDDTYWGYTSVPENGVIWWKSLPNSLPYYELFDLVEFEAAINLSAFGINLKPILKAISTAKELGMKFIPQAWIAYIQSGWRIIDHIEGFVWIRPLPSGSMSVSGLVVELKLDTRRLLDTKADYSSDIKNKLKDHFPHKNDVDKIFYLQSEPAFNEKHGQIISREDFLKIDPSDIRSWTEISEFDIVDID